MTLNKFARRLRREISTHPKQAGVLGLLALVAIYFWAPLVMGHFAKDPSQTAGTTVPAKSGTSVSGGVMTAAATPPQAGPKAAESKTPDYSWQQLVRWMEGDPRTRPAHLSGTRDPFVIGPVRTVAVKRATPRPPEPEVTPQTLNLVLAGTILGGESRAARINGRTYEIGSTIEVTKNGKKFSFVLAEIEARQVVLKRQDKRFELKISSPGNTGRIELFGSAR